MFKATPARISIEDELVLQAVPVCKSSIAAEAYRTAADPALS